ncbi:MAG: type II toxin-antitoxin system RelE/ParE family toxin [Spirochaetaceae bacterium]|jgi:addiction module RelE/StbE family toxin|nr:type II toxin-antitoxin system RelE/ParE family toxin [Spirochaetaceae bacterium]
MPDLRISPDAKKDLRDIQTYISEKLESPRAALNVVSTIIEKIKSLRRFPGKGILLSSKVRFETNYRFLISGSYLIFYRYENETVFVDRVIYAKRDYIKILFPEYKDTNFLDEEK